jgi:small-conductance mechanosensitive channel
MRPVIWLMVALLVFFAAPLVLAELLPTFLSAKSAQLLTGLLLLLSGLLMVQLAVRLGVLALERIRAQQLLPVLRLGQFIGYLLVLLFSASAAGYNLSGFLAGGTVVTVVIGLAAQSSLSNIFAGLILTASRAFSVGDMITVRTWAFSGIEYTGTIHDITLIYTTLATPAGKVKIPNARMVDAALTSAPSAPVTLVLPAQFDLAQLEAMGLRYQMSKLSQEGLELVVYGLKTEDMVALQGIIQSLTPSPVLVSGTST